MKWTTRNKVIVLVVVVAIVTGSSVFGYLVTMKHNPYPGLTTTNNVVNETIAENFSNFTQTSSPPTPEFNFTSVTNIFYHNSNSTLEMSAQIVAFYIGYLHLVIVNTLFEVIGNISSTLHPTGAVFTVTNTWFNPLNVSNVAGWLINPGSMGPIAPESNVSPPQVNIYGGGGGQPLQAKFGLLNQTNVGKTNQFGFSVGFEYKYEAISSTSSDIGTQILHITASLQGLGQPIYVTFNITLRNVS